MNKKIVIYQMLPRLFANSNATCKPGGTIEDNGSGKMNHITDRVLGELRALGATHVWYTGIIEHANKTDYSRFGIRPDNHHVVKGQAGSPYAIKDYYDVDPDIAEDVDNRMQEFEALVKRTHDAGLKVIIDFVPNHVARQYHSDAAPKGIRDFGADDDSNMFFARDNNFYYITCQKFQPQVFMGEGEDAYVEFPAKATGNDCFSAFPGINDWYETVKLNYGVDYGNGSRHFDPTPNTWMKMLHILRFWASKGVDGFRCDMAHMVPIEFWRWAIAEVKAKYPKVKFIAEIYDMNLYRPYIFEGGFDYLYDKVNLYDTLRGIATSNLSAAQITNCWQRLEGISDNMLNFLENHDEQRFGSEFYCGDPKKVVPSLVVSSMIGRGPMMIYAGQELGERGMDAEGFSGRDGRTTIFDYWSPSTLRRWSNGGEPTLENLTDDERQLRATYGRILGLLTKEKALAEGEFFDLMYVNYQSEGVDPHRHYLFMRHHGKDTLVIAVNFGDSEAKMKVNIPRHAFDHWDMQPYSGAMTELLSGDRERKTFSWETPMEIEVPPYGAAIWRLRSRGAESR